MSRMKSIFAVLMLTAIVGTVPQAQAYTVKVVIAGSSALWQTAALGTFGTPDTANAGQGHCSSLLTGCTSPTFHWTSAKSGGNEPYLNDSRPSTPNQDLGPTWVIWDSATNPNVWIFTKVDSAVGDRCYFARPACNVVLPNAAPLTGANLITVWNNTACSPNCDTNLPAGIQALLNNGEPVTAAASDIRPEDAAFAQARANSALGGSAYSHGGSDGLDGLGYNVNNAPGVPATYPAGSTHGVGNPFLSGMPTSTATANVLAFNITGKDPFTNTTAPAFTVTDVGGEPVVFVVGHQNSLAGLTNATDSELQQVFSGNDCDASAFSGMAAGGINIFLRESLSGTYNTVEATVFRRPTVYTGSTMSAGAGVLGVSQENNLGSIIQGTVGTASLANNPLTWKSANGSTPTTQGSGSCPNNSVSQTGARYRGIGTGEVVEGVQCSNNPGSASCYDSGAAGGFFNTAQDGIAYSFFSYGNIKALAGSNNYGYIRLDGVDPIFQIYGSNYDPGQLTYTGQSSFTPGTLPLDTPCGTAAAGTAFPCQESKIWANGFSFPNVRNGLYRAWNILRTISTGTPGTALTAVVKASQAYVVSSVPDYIPYTAVTCTASSVPACSPTVSDLGLKLLRSHYEQRDGNGTKLGTCTPIKNTATECGGDMGGFIIPNSIGVTTYAQLQLVQNTTTANGHDVYEPVQRPQ